MKKNGLALFMTLFGILDFISLFRGYQFPLAAFQGRYSWDLLTLITLLLYASFLFSGIIFIRHKRKLYFIYYFQFPLRFLLAVFSFGFLSLVFQKSASGEPLLAVAICGFLEVGRLLVTIMAHRRWNLR